ncbi:MAG: DUF6769 family protein [Bacteroidaceae bacterium]
MKQKFYISFLFIALAALFVVNATPHHHHGADICIVNDVEDFCGEQTHTSSTHHTTSDEKAELVCFTHTVMLLSKSQNSLVEQLCRVKNAKSFHSLLPIDACLPALFACVAEQRVVPRDFTMVSARCFRNCGLRAPPCRVL